MARTEKTKYLNYIEDTKKHHDLIKKIVKTSGLEAVSRSKSNDIEVTFLKGTKIIREDTDGSITIIEQVDDTPRKVKVGSKTTIHKG